MSRPAVVYTIERRSTPPSRHRYLGVLATGEPRWAELSAPFRLFGSKSAANTFRRTRMRGHAADAMVVRHTVH